MRKEVKTHKNKVNIKQKKIKYAGNPIKIAQDI